MLLCLAGSAVAEKAAYTRDSDDDSAKLAVTDPDDEARTPRQHLDSDSEEAASESSDDDCVPNPGKDHARICEDVQLWINAHPGCEGMCSDVEPLIAAKSLLASTDACHLDFEQPEHHRISLLERNGVKNRLKSKITTGVSSIVYKMPDFIVRIEGALNCEVPLIKYCPDYAGDQPCLTCAPGVGKDGKPPVGPDGKPIDQINVPRPKDCPCAKAAYERAKARFGGDSDDEDDSDLGIGFKEDKICPCAKLCPCKGEDGLPSKAKFGCPCDDDLILQDTMPAGLLPHAHCSQILTEEKCLKRKHDPTIRKTDSNYDYEPCQWYEANPENVPPILEPYCGHPIVAPPSDEDDSLLESHCDKYTACGACDNEPQCQWDHSDEVCEPLPQPIRVVAKLPTKTTTPAEAEEAA